MKKEILLYEIPEKFAEHITEVCGSASVSFEQYMEACGNLSWYDIVTAVPSLVFLVTGWKSNGKENACLQFWSSFVGSGVDNFICFILNNLPIRKQEKKHLSAPEYLSKAIQFLGLQNKQKLSLYKADLPQPTNVNI